MQVSIHPMNYKMFDYEIKLHIDEINKFFPDMKISIIKKNIIEFNTEAAEKDEVISKLSRLTYSKSFFVDNIEFHTLQYKKELSCGKTGHQNRQSTRYGAHGLHEYKGKFNPQIVACLFNIMGIRGGDNIIDPFCGSGTSLVEASYSGINSVGYDINPLACFISNTKANSHNLNGQLIIDAVNRIEINYRSHGNSEIKSERYSYLEKWFEREYLECFESIRSCILELEDLNLKNILLLIASNLLREFSKQEPGDLRIRRRKSEYPEKTVIESFLIASQAFSKNISNLNNSIVFENVDCLARNVDIRNASIIDGDTLADAAITSPPYATALPYIDTQRLSLVWLDLINPGTINQLERELIGSREITKTSTNSLKIQLLNEVSLPVELTSLCNEMIGSLDDKDGFRRQATPYVIFRYFKDMEIMFKKVSKMIKPGGEFSLVVGSNHTVLGGKRYDLDTPRYLELIAKSQGWKVLENRPLDAYQRYGLHSKNASKTEHLLRLKNC